MLCPICRELSTHTLAHMRLPWHDKINFLRINRMIRTHGMKNLSEIQYVWDLYVSSSEVGRYRSKRAWICRSAHSCKVWSWRLRLEGRLVHLENTLLENRLWDLVPRAANHAFFIARGSSRTARIAEVSRKNVPGFVPGSPGVTFAL